MTESPVRAGIYCRMSVAADGDTVKVDHQEKLCREAAARLGWEVADVYQDNNRSAWKKNRKRPGWDRMLADVETGKISAIMVYHGDRLIRQPDDLGVLLKLADGRGIRLASPTGERDLGNGDDRFVLYIEAAMAMRESDNTSRRRIAQYERWRREGRTRPGGRGGRAFGYATDGLTVVEAEASALREAARRLTGGEPIGAIARDLAGRGMTGTSGQPLSHTSLRKSLLRPRTAGLMPDGVSAAAWPPILGREEWESLCSLIGGRAKSFHSRATNARRHLLSGIAVCGACGTGLQLRAESTRRNGVIGPVCQAGCVHRSCRRIRAARSPHAADGYGCVEPGCRKVQRNILLLDAYVARRVVNRLARPDNPESRAPERPGLAAEFRALTEARAEAAAAVEDPSSAHLSLLLARLERIDRRLAGLRELAGESARDRLLRDHAGITYDEFCAETLAVRRSLVAACFEVVVLPASGRGPGFRTEDVRLTPR